MHKSHFQKVIVLSILFCIAAAVVGCGSPKKVTFNSKGLRGDSESKNDNQAPSFKPPDDKMSEQVSAKQPEMLDANFSGGLANGLYPQIGSSPTARFGGGLFPTMDDSFVSAQPAGDTGKTSNGGNAALVDAPPAGSNSEESNASLNTKNGSRTSVESGGNSGMSKSALLERAVDCFSRHEESDAMNLLYAYLLINDDVRDEYPLSWYKGLKEPRVAFRWGVGVTFNAAKGMTGRHSVIGDPGGDDGDTSRSSGRKGGRGLGAVGGGAPGATGTRTGVRTYRDMDTSRPDGFLMYYTGDFGEQLISQLDKRRTDEDAYFGKILKDIPLREPTESKSPSKNQGNAGNAALLDDGPIVGGGRAAPGGRGAPAGGNATRQREDSSIIDRAKGTGPSQEPDDELVGTIIPGVMLVGQGNKDELVQRARSLGLDVLILFNVSVRQSKSDERTNLTTLRMIDLRSDSDDFVYKGRQLKDTDVEEALKDDRDLVKSELDRAFNDFADNEYKASEMPEGLNESNVEKRVDKILSQDHSNPLPAALEIVRFYRRDLLSTEFTEKALNQLFDSETGNNLLSTDVAERLAVISKWLPADDSVKKGADDEDL
jgi:hypothetical protein